MRKNRRLGLGSAVALLFCGAAVSCQPDGLPRHHHIEIRDLAFPAEPLSVARGDTVTWTNNDIVPHTVNDGAGAWESGDLRTTESFTMVFPRGADRVDFYCSYHPFMKGSMLAR